MNETRTCPITGEALPPDRYVSRTATGTLRGLFTDLPGLMADLDIALAKQARFAARVGARSTGTPLPFSYAASEAGWVARTTILIWVDWVTAIRGHPLPQTWAGIAAYLRSAVDWIARHPDGPRCVDDLTAALRNARHAIDRPADRRYAGVCGGTTINADGAATKCTEALYGLFDADDVECTRCGARWPIRQRRQQMLTALEDHHLTAVDLARAVDGFGVTVTAQLVRQWKHRGLLTPTGVDPAGRPLYRVGDVLDVVAAGRTAAAAV